MAPGSDARLMSSLRRPRAAATSKRKDLIDLPECNRKVCLITFQVFFFFINRQLYEINQQDLENIPSSVLSSLIAINISIIL